MQIIKHFDDGSALAQLTPAEANLIQTALTKPVKRKVNAMALKLQEIEDAVATARKFNEQFIKTFYQPRRKKK